MSESLETPAGTGVRHVVLFNWVDGVTPEQIAALKAGLSRLPALIPQIRDYRFGADLGINPGNAAFVVVADFDSRDDYLVYRDHPDHRELIANHVTPIVANRMAAQFPR